MAYSPQTTGPARSAFPLPSGAPVPEPAGYLGRVFRLSEEENRRSRLPKGIGGALLDIGTHEGQFTRRVAGHLKASRVTGVELLEHHAEVARARGVEVIVADVDEGLPVDDGQFQVVNANQIIEHVRRTDIFLGEIHRVLAPGGIACISTNNLASWHKRALADARLSAAAGARERPGAKLRRGIHDFWGHHTGLLTAGGRRKAAYFAFRRASRALSR